MLLFFTFAASSLLPKEWYLEIPIVSRTYLTASFITTAACALELVSPFSLYYNFKLIFHEGEVWRLVTNFLFFGKFSLEFVFHMYFLMRYCRLLEENSFRGRTSDFVFMLFLSALFMTVSVVWVGVCFVVDF
jgi:Derlin-2/3|tara:strand:- start:527 stop:922 length:396 start_codon:yes stop_codon:yes gene_type:complete